MHLDMCFPKEIEKARENRTPVVIVGGTVEYHAAHLGYGCDTLIPLGLVEKLAERKDIIIAPPISYTPASWGVAGEESGTIHVDEVVFEGYLYDIFSSMLSAGLRNIYAVLFHQIDSPNPMPMTASFMKAAKRATMRYLERTMGQGWWGSESYSDYYANLGGGDDPFSWIKVVPAVSFDIIENIGSDHAGKYETSMLMSLYPEAVKMDRISDVDHWFTADAHEASLALGDMMVQRALEDLDKVIV